MFELITGSSERPLRERAPGSKIVALVAHVVVLIALVGIPLLRVTNSLPEVPTIMAFVVPPPAAPPPPPPPPPAPRAVSKPEPPPSPKPTGALTAPIETPTDLKPEQTTGDRGALTAVEGGVAGGVEGGVAGGIVGGIPGGLVSSAQLPPPPPLPPPPAPRGPVRIGGQIMAPALIHRVEPIYPDIASAAQLTGVVILEAVVGTDGCVESVKVLRSRHPLLDRAAIDALKQWQYSPLSLNSLPASFVLTVTFNFSVQH